jgi:hypothetical protein
MMHANALMIMKSIGTLALLLSLSACNMPQATPATPIATNPGSPTDIETAASIPGPTRTITPMPTPMPSDLVWFGPNMGSLDYAELFTRPEQWSEARSRINVFKFHTQNVLPYPCTICGDNTLDTLVEAKAFQALTEWGIPIDVDVGAVKEWGCNGTEEFRVTRETIRNIRANGGEVMFLDMDEPYMGGELMANGKTCGFTMEESADITAKYMRLVKGAYPNINVGDTEPFPYFSVSELEQWIEALEARGTTPAFFHLDVNMMEGGARHDSRRVSSDLQKLSQFFDEHQIPFGVIFTANTNWNARSDRAYFDSTMTWIRLVNDAIRKPQHVVFNSWLGPAPSGAHEFPINLPDNDPFVYSHSRLIIEGLDVFGRR